MKGGVKGFLKGTWKGLRGLVFKPVTGVVDGVSKLTEGVSNTFIEDSAKKALKARAPRMFYGRERIFKAYQEYEPAINKFVCKKKPKKYPSFTFMDCILLKEQVPSKNGTFETANLCLWITLERVFLIHLDLYKFIWKMRVENISEAISENNSVNLVYKTSTKSIHVRFMITI
jgi:vacuolar protein sorting-associated protein 13A/C